MFSGESDLNTIGLTENALNIIVSKAISAEAIRLRSNQFFLKSDYSNLGSENGSLCVIRGYLYTVKPGMGQLILNVNNCTSAFFRPNLVSQVLEDGATFRASKGRENVLKGLEVYVTYERKSKSGTDLNAMQYRTGTIRGFGNRVDEQEFVIQSENGTQETTTVKEYIEKTYNVKVGKPWLKAVNVGKRERPCWFAPEHLRILPYQIFARLVPEHLTKDMLHVACQPPRQTRALIERGLSHMGVNPAEGFVSLVRLPLQK